MSLNIQKYQRKPFTVEAVQVTVENMQEVAVWCGGEIVLEKHGGRLIQYILVDVEHAVRERQKKAFVEDWVLQMGNGFKCYSKRAFPNNFEPTEEFTGYPGTGAVVPAGTERLRADRPALVI